MLILSNYQRRNSLKLLTLRSIAVSLIISLIFFQPISFAQQASVLGLPKPGTMVSLSSSYVPVIVKGLHIHPENPILFDFILDTGDSGLGVNSAQLRSESEKLVKYFLATLTIPEDDLWVNLSPYEKNRIIPEQLGQTIMGRDMLAQDYILKQLTASLIYPGKDLGKEFWNKVYAKAQNRFGSNEIPVNTFNKVWIVADKAKVYVHNDTAFVVACHMKVMLEEDYLAMYKHEQTGISRSANAIASQIVREVVLPELEKEVNQGKNFANLRQIFNSMILAAWYKKSLKEALLNQVYSNRDKINGIDVQDKNIKEQIYQEYLKAYKKGVFNYIKEDVQADGQAIPRKYFSGGEIGIKASNIQEVGIDDTDAAKSISRGAIGEFVSVLVTTPSSTDVNAINKNLPNHDSAMNSDFSWEDTDRVKEFIQDDLGRIFDQPFEVGHATGEMYESGITGWEEMAKLEAEYENAATTDDRKKQIVRILNGFIDLSNAKPWLDPDKSGKPKFESLRPADETYMSQFSDSGSQQEALESLKKGEFFIEILAGGMAQRAMDSLKNLGVELPDSEYKIWNLNFWKIIREAQKLQTARDSNSQELLEQIKQIKIPAYEQEYTIGQRLLYAISKGIDDIQGLTQEQKAQVRKNLKIVIHVNDEIITDVKKDLETFNFFGFTPSHILLVNGGYGPAYKITDHGLEEEKGVKETWNHLFAFMENKWKTDGVYKFDGPKGWVETYNTVNHFLNEQGAEYGLLRRVNDAILLHPEGAMDVGFLSAFFGARKQNPDINVLYQVMPNTASNKGGLSVTDDDMEPFSFPYEGLDSQNSLIAKKLSGMTTTPYNRLYMLYDLKSVVTITDNNKIPLSVKIKKTGTDHGTVLLVSPESPSGNLLLVPGIHGLAVQRDNDLLFDKKILTPGEKEGNYSLGSAGHQKGERIHDIKTVTDFTKVLVPVYTAMDQALDLEKFKDEVNKIDRAMANQKQDNAVITNGGIDLNSKNLQMDINGDGIDLKFDPAMVEQFRRGDFSGVEPIIIKITPIQDPLAMLGDNPGKEDETVAKV